MSYPSTQGGAPSRGGVGRRCGVHGLESAFVGDAPELKILGCKELLARAAANVTRNSARYAGEGGPLKVVVTNSGDVVRIEFIDGGEGVPDH